MKKRIWTALLAGIMSIGILAGCGGAPAESGGTSDAATDTAPGVVP